MTLLEFSMSPYGKGESLSADVAKIMNVIDKSGIPYKFNSMGTIIEGEWEEVVGLVHQCFEVMKQEASRISISIKMDYREGEVRRMSSKVEKVEKILHKELKQ